VDPLGQRTGFELDPLERRADRGQERGDLFRFRRHLAFAHDGAAWIDAQILVVALETSRPAWSIIPSLGSPDLQAGACGELNARGRESNIPSPP
jgi:hypothetical protein